MLKYDIAGYLKYYPELTYDGINRIQSGPEYRKQRADLLNATDEIEKCIEWLSKYFVSKAKIFNPSSSYGLKHYVEKYFDSYISTGSFVAAVKILNLKHKEYPGDQNIYMSFMKEYFAKYKETHRT
jgi:hypothetical protein